MAEPAYKSKGCSGGDPLEPLRYASQAFQGYLTTEARYGFTGTKGPSCRLAFLDEPASDRVQLAGGGFTRLKAWSATALLAVRGAQRAGCPAGGGGGSRLLLAAGANLMAHRPQPQHSTPAGCAAAACGGRLAPADRL